MLAPSQTQNIDAEKVRRETRGCDTVLHFNNAGASLPPDCVHEAVVNHLELERTLGGYEASEQQWDKVEHTYQAIAQMLHCQPAEVAFIENATRAWDMAFYAIPFEPGDKVLTSVAEYASNVIAYLQLAKRRGIEVVVVPSDAYGQLDTEALERLIDNRTKLITITHIPTHGGLVNPAAEVGRIAKAHGILYLLDACQSAGQMPLDVDALGCDMLSATGRKYLRASRGTGFLYVRQSVLEQLEPPFLDLHAATWTDWNQFEIRPDARKFENWESYVAGRIGLGVAVDYALALGLENIQQRIWSLASMLRESLQAIPGVALKDLGKEKCGIVTFTKAGETPAQIQARLRQASIHVWVSVAEYARFDMRARNETAFVRASVHYYNTQDEVRRFCEALAAV